MQTERTRTRLADIVVPGSISNLGPGFDALSVAVQVYLRARIVEVRPSEPDTIALEFNGRRTDGREPDRVRVSSARGRKSAWRRLGCGCRSAATFPQTAGLGSSAAAAVAGLRLYEAVTDVRARWKTGWRWQPSSRDIPTTRRPRSSAASPSAASAKSDAPSRGRHGGPRPSSSSSRRPNWGCIRRTPGGSLPDAIPLADAIFNLQRALLLSMRCARAATRTCARQ